MLGQVQHGPALWPDQLGRDGDDLAAQRRTARDGVLVAGEGAGGAQQVCGSMTAHWVQALLAPKRLEGW